MPRDDFGRERDVLAAPGDGRWPGPTLARLSDRYSVSREAVVRRVYTLGLADWTFLQQKQAEYSAAARGTGE
jgi:Zn-dependent peptidase ImmA (M78 family)